MTNETPTVTWNQIEPRRRYRATVKGKSYDLLYQGREAVGPDLSPGWYVEGGFDGKGSEFMARRLQEAVNQATARILDGDNKTHHHLKKD